MEMDAGTAVLERDAAETRPKPATVAEATSAPALSLTALASAASAMLAACGGGGGDAARETVLAAAAPNTAAGATMQAAPTSKALATPSMTSDPMPAVAMPTDGINIDTSLSDSASVEANATSVAPTPIPTPATAASRDASRFLTQATMGIKSLAEIAALQAKGYAAWLDEQFALPAYNHSAYIEGQRGRDNRPGEKKTVSEEMSYEAIWQQWLRGADQLRSRVTWALTQIFVISNIAPDIRPVAMSSYMDMLNKYAFGNFRDLLQGVTLHPAMGYYLNMLESEKEDPVKGTHPNENYPREVQQLFTIGLVQLNIDGSPKLDGQGRTIPTYNEDVVKGFAKAFSGWAYGGLDNKKARTFHDHDDNDERLWRVPMIAWQMWHSSGPKQLLDGKVLPAGQTAEKDMADALDLLFNHPNVGPFIGRQLIQRLVTSNPTPGYIQRVATVFNNNGSGVRGDMRAVIKAILLDTEARAPNSPANPRFGKQREPVLRLATFLRGLNATSRNGRNDIHYLDSPDDALAQSPLLAPSVFNFYSPNFRPAGPVAAAGLVAPEFQITSEISVVGSLNFFADFFESGGYGGGNSRQRLNYKPLRDLGKDSAVLIDFIDQLFFNAQMSASTKGRLRSVINAIPANDRTRRAKSAMLLAAMSPDFVIQK
jgi:uncharacterized protein (DUF1800 family)